MQSPATPASRPAFSLLPAIGLTLAASAVILGGVVLLNLGGGIPMADLIRDPAAIAGMPAYTGLLSQIGLFLWAAAAAICLFCARLASRGGPDEAGMARFFFASGALTLLLGLDDAFLLHEDVFPRIGIPEKVVLASHVLLTAAYLLVFARTILTRTGHGLLAMALFFFAASVVLDVLNPPAMPYLAEDAAKLTGILGWLAYFSCTGLAMLQPRAAAGAAAGIEPVAARMTGAPAGAPAGGAAAAFKSGQTPSPASCVERY